MENARPATVADRDQIIDLAETAIAELAPTRGGALWMRREARSLPVGPTIDADLADPSVLVLVGTIDDAIVGYAVLRSEQLTDGARLAVIDELYVLPGARAVGVGEAMMDQLVESATAQGCVGIDALALPGNRATKNFFETFGLVARAIVVHRSLPPASS